MPGLIAKATRPQANPQDVERIVVAAVRVIHDPKISPQLVQMMKSAGDPANGLAQATLTLMRQLYEKSKASMPPAAIVPAGKQVLIELAKLAAAAKLFKATPQLLAQAAKIIFTRLQQQMQKPAAPGAPAAGSAAPAPAVAAPAAPAPAAATAPTT